MTSQEPHPQLIADPDIPDTEVILVAQPAPVFVDSTGRRRRLLRRLAYGFGAFCMVYGGLISLSLAGGPVSPSAVMPFPDLIDDGTDPTAGKLQPTPEPIVTAPKSVLVNDATPRRGGAAGSWDNGTTVNNRMAADPTTAAGPSTPPTRKPSKPTATPVRPTTKPVEATPSATTTTDPTPTATATVTPSPSSGLGTGTKAPGSGGGGVADATDDTDDTDDTSSSLDDPADSASSADNHWGSSPGSGWGDDDAGSGPGTGGVGAGGNLDQCPGGPLSPTTTDDNSTGNAEYENAQDWSGADDGPNWYDYLEDAP